MGVPILDEVLIIFALSIAVLLICHRLRIPSTVGFLITGVLSGPYGLGFVKNIEDVQTLADVGIILLLFTIGLEFSLSKIFLYKRYFLLGGALQVLLTVAAGWLLAEVFNQTHRAALFWGFLLALSSTAIVLRSFEERREGNSPQGNLSLGILIFQDVIAVVMMLAIPFLGSAQNEIPPTYFYSLLLGAVILLAAVTAGHYIIPRLFLYITRTRSRELFLLCTLTICFSVAWLASAFGLSLALGAFLAGLLISDSDYKSQAVGNILPLQELFTSFFFVSIGMLLDLHFVLGQPLVIAGATAAILLVKFFLVAITSLIVGMPIRVAVLTGLALCQIGEFSFVLSKSGIEYGLATEYSYQLFLAVALLSMAATPFLIRYSPNVAAWLQRLPMPTKLRSGLQPAIESKEAGAEDHVIIVGYGLSGRNLALAARQSKVSYVILEMNPDTVRLEKLRGEPIFFGDATHEAVLNHVAIGSARAVAVVINDPVAAVRVVEQVRKCNPGVFLVVRTRFLNEMRTLYLAGADEVVIDEFGASIEIFSWVLRHYEVDEEHVSSIIEDLRFGGHDLSQTIYRQLAGTTAGTKAKEAPDFHLKSFSIDEGAALIGRTLGNSGIKQKFGLTVVLLKRNNHVVTNLTSDELFCRGDTLMLVGARAQLELVEELFRAHLHV